MKKQIMLTAALFVAAFASAQTEVNIEKLFHVTETPVEVVEPLTVKEGIVFIGDTRTPDKITDGQYKGMRVQKQKRMFRQGATNVQFANMLAFRRTPSGISKDKVVDINAVPRSCMMQLKPLSGGKLTFYAYGGKEDDTRHLYVAVRNGLTFKNIAVLDYVKDPAVTGKKDAPYSVQSCDYSYADGDELWIYSNGNVNLFALTFEGKIDNGFTGSDPVEVSKAVRRAQKNK